MRMKVSDAVFEKGTKEWKEVFEGNHFPLSKNAALVLNERYLLKEGDELIESFEDLLKRVSSVLAEPEKDKKKIKKWTEKFYDVMATRRFLPGSPTLMNAGRPGKNAFPACFVIDVKDNLAHHRDSIFGAVKQMAGIHKSGGGTGCSFSNLRPFKDDVSSTNGAASGPISFMHVFNNVIEVVMQGGMRRGAHMSILRVDHPDILEFISCKGRLDEMGKRMFIEIINRIGIDEKHPVAKVIGKVINEYQLRNMNISVGLTREFKKALVHDGVYFLKNPRSGEVVKQLKARDVFRKIAEYAHKNGEPGIVDLDRINQDNPINGTMIESTNPCGEQPLEAWESCNLGSVVLNEHLKEGEAGLEMDWDKFRETIFTAVRMLDNVIDATPFPYPHIEEKTKANRKIGLGLMGLADIMIDLGISYDSQEGVEFCKLVHSKLTLFGREASAELAKEKGEFPEFKNSVFATGQPDEIKYRNATVTTIAPTGTISTIADCSPAIEPIFKLAYKRNVLDGKTLYVINPKFQEIAKERRFDYPDIMQEVAETGSCRGVEGVPEDIQKLFATALDVSPDYHVDILCAAQGHLRPLDPDGVENAVSKTLNLPFEASVEDVQDAFARALKGGAKGATVYRSGSRDMEVFASINSVRFKSLVAKKKRPKQKMSAQNYRIPLPCGDFYFTVVPDETGRPFEVFFSPEHKMDCVDSGMTQLCRQISLSLRCGVGIEDIVNQHLGVRCTKCEGGIGFGERKVFSCWDALAKVLMEYMECSEKRNEMMQKNLARVLFGICPECKSELESAGGSCRTCPNCKKYYTCL